MIRTDAVCASMISVERQGYRRKGWQLGATWAVLLLCSSCHHAGNQPTVEAASATTRNTIATPPPRPGTQAGKPSYASGELVIKLTPEAGAVLDQALEVNRQPTETGLAWLDALNLRYGVSAIAPVFRHHLDSEAIKRKYPERARRAPPGAKIPSLKHIYTFQMRAGTDILLAVEHYERHPGVEYAQPNYLATTQGAE